MPEFNLQEIELAVRFIEALAWPATAFFGFLLLRPWRVVTKIVNHGGKISAGGVGIDLQANIDEVAHSIGDEDVKPLESSISNEQGANYPIDGYKLIIDSWSNLADQMLRCLKGKTGESVSLLRPRVLIEKVQEAGLIGSKITDELVELLDIRNLVKKNGKSKFESLKINTESARRYAASTAALIEKHFSPN